VKSALLRPLAKSDLADQAVYCAEVNGARLGDVFLETAPD